MTVLSARGCHLYDASGRGVLDFTSQGGLLGLGHAHPELCLAMTEQFERLPYLHGRYSFETTISCCGRPLEVSRKALHAALSQVASRIMSVGGIHVNVSGSAGIMTALKLCRISKVRSSAPLSYRRRLLSGEQRFPRFAALAFEKVYHGQLGEAHLLSDTARSDSVGSSPGLHVRRIPPPLCRVRGFDREAYLTSAKRALDQMASEFGWRALAFFFEPFGGQGEEFDAESIRELIAAARAEGMFAIADEFKTGQGRTGSQFACEDIGVRPDAVIFSKILSGGHPCSAVAIAETLDLSGLSDIPDAGTFSATPLACASMLAVLRILDSEDLITHARVRGGELLNGLRSALDGCSAVRGISGKGLLACIILSEPDAQDRIFDEALRQRLLVFPTGREWGNPRIVLMPPLIVSQDEVQQAVAIIAKAVRASSRLRPPRK